jgi:SAM-dependent methyltransferase
MNREAWIRARRQINEQRMDTLFAPIYDERWGATIDPTHRRFVTHFLSLLPPSARVMDAACGTGKYWALLLDAGCRIVGVDQSAGMLRRAGEKHPGVQAEKLGLQELSFENEFDGTICIDAMENVFPEHWPLVLANFHKALTVPSLLYLTVELPQDDLPEIFEAAVKAGLPVTDGEYLKEGGYHYYPGLEQVRRWVEAACFVLVGEAVGDGYYHLLLRKFSGGESV